MKNKLEERNRITYNLIKRAKLAFCKFMCTGIIRSNKNLRKKKTRNAINGFIIRIERIIKRAGEIFHVK